MGIFHEHKMKLKSESYDEITGSTVFLYTCPYCPEELEINMYSTDENPPSIETLVPLGFLFESDPGVS